MLWRALAGLVAIGVVIAGAAVWRIVPSRPTWIHRLRWPVAVLTTYGATSFIYAAMRGRGLFPALPYFLQGAFIGGFVILPLGWIVSVVRTSNSFLRKRTPRPGW